MFQRESLVRDYFQNRGRSRRLAPVHVTNHQTCANQQRAHPVRPERIESTGHKLQICNTHSHLWLRDSPKNFAIERDLERTVCHPSLDQQSSRCMIWSGIGDEQLALKGIPFLLDNPKCLFRRCLIAWRRRRRRDRDGGALRTPAVGLLHAHYWAPVKIEQQKLYLPHFTRKKLAVPGAFFTSEHHRPGVAIHHNPTIPAIEDFDGVCS
mmetsp:Transcript_38510/g.78980  ORF Transcript_38510/g.78980 Transcript_38510/m.78980 type:complete len:209 (+) Transcript_38510:146-772(+)